ncbi:MAG TPA: beta-ketoacyl synthase N-terminal-like domain-containing protein [Kiritimatiellia bacterium]|nr:beta-ketoacyl synthase N-terminal-like domain-containing protein [Kiritimatiellia bacterium]
MPSGLEPVCIVAQELLSAYGRGVARGADGLLAGQSALRPAAGPGWPATATAQFAGQIPADELDVAGAGRFAALLRAGIAGMEVPADAPIYLATTAGAIDELEAAVFAGAEFAGQGGFSRLHGLAAAAFGVVPERIQVVSSACASSTAALALAAGAIRRGETECALVVGADIVSEFVLAGFAALMASDPSGAHPFDADRKGVALGEAFAAALLMRAGRAAREGRPCLGAVAGWSLTCDANHLTGPSRDGAPLAEAIRGALDMAGAAPVDVAALCAHGTGTVYNDQMEMLAFRRVFGEQPLPTFSVKGGTGHLLGAAGLAEVLLALEFLRRGRIPPTVGLRRAADDAVGWVSAEARPVHSAGLAVSTNSGFGGTNAAVALTLAPRWRPAPAGKEAPHRLGSAWISSAAATSEEAGSLPRNFSRFNPGVRRAYFAVRRALAAAGLEGAAKLIGLMACDRAGSEQANWAYFADYVNSGRTLARGQMFAYTLPTAIAAECAIACRLTGPLLSVADAGGSLRAAEQAARGLLADGLCDAVVLLSTDSAEARAAAWGFAGSQPKDNP